MRYGEVFLELKASETSRIISHGMSVINARAVEH